MKRNPPPYFLLVWLALAECIVLQAAENKSTVAEPAVGQVVDIARSAYAYRADRKADENPPESWIALMQYANLPLNKKVNANSPVLKKVLCGLLWEEVRRVRRVELAWSGDPQRRPKPDEIKLTFFDAEAKNTIPTWWNKPVLRNAGIPEVSANGNSYAFAIPADTFGLIVAMKTERDATAYDVPVVRAITPDVWKQMDLEIEWGFDTKTANLDYSGRIEAYDGIAANIRPIANDVGTIKKDSHHWTSVPKGSDRRGVRLSLLYHGTSKQHKVWPYNCEPEDVARTIITVWTKSGNFSFTASDLERGPILAPEYGFFVRPADKSGTAAEFIEELKAKNLATVRQRTRQHPEQSWQGATSAMFPGKTLPAIPKPEFEPPMKVEVPCKQLTAQWNLGAWHLLRHAVKDENGRLRFNDFPYGILAAETYLILETLDLMGLHKEAADGLDQWLSLPMQNEPPVGLFADGQGCLTQASGPTGVGGNMDGVHGMGPGAIMYALNGHYRRTGDKDWLKANAPRIKANVEWILRQRRLLADIIPNGDRLWCKGLQPAHQVTPDSGGQLMQFYESEGYYWLAVRQFADILGEIDPAEAARLAAEAEAYRKDLRAAVDRSIALSPVTQVRDGTYRSFIPFACYVRGFASGPWSWRRPGSGWHVGGLYWDTVQSAESLVSPAAILSPDDRRVHGCLDVLEDRLLLENPKVAERSKGYDADKDWFSHAGWQYQPGLERHANLHLAADDEPNFLRSWLNQYATILLPDHGYVFREHTVGGPPDKIFEEAAFLERFRNMLVMEDADALWLAKAAPREWLKQGKKISVKNAPTNFGATSYEIISDADNGRITATVELPGRCPPKSVLLRFRHPKSAPMKCVAVNGRPWTDFDKDKELIRLYDAAGTVSVTAQY
jgi:hypothetical protein